MKRGSPGWDEEQIPLTAPEVRRLLYRLMWMPSPTGDSVLVWSRWRRRQAIAQRCRYQRRLKLLNSYLRL